MKLHNLAIIFIIIILPISILLGEYTQSQAKTLSLQISYDTKLNNATYDALKAFQLNTINSDTSDLADSKLRDIEASANTFFNSIASNFNMAGYNKDILEDYVPALVYTMYDGYYIYSPYTNTLDAESQGGMDATYKNGDRISGLKPYIYYSCRYVRETNNDDFVITYSLDNYITIQGVVGGKGIFDYGYLLDNIKGANTSNLTYRGVSIQSEGNLEEYVYNPSKDKIEKYKYIQINGVKYYKDDDNSWFSIMNGKKHNEDNFSDEASVAIKYYQDAYDFSNRVKGYGLGTLTGKDAVDENGEHTLQNKLGTYSIFDFKTSDTDSKSIEDPDSNFNQQRLAVIRYVIEKNLSIAISNYNNYSGVKTDFEMPKLKEDEWDKILNNVSIISFLQGLNIGGKVYNGYSIITNNKNKEVVNEDSIYILTNDNQYHRANDKDLITNGNIKIGILDIDVEIKSIITNEGKEYAFVPKGDEGNPIIGCYNSIINQSGINATENFYKYMEDKGTLAQAYYTALGRERYGMYKTNKNTAVEKQKFK